MIYKSLIKDFFYEDSGSTSLSYYLTCGDDTIYAGRAYNPKGIKINICKLIEDWVWNDMPDFRSYNGVMVVHDDACKVFNLYDGDGNLLEEYMVFLSYEDLDMPMFTYRGIDGRVDPRQKIFFGGLSDTAFTLTFDISNLNFIIGNMGVGWPGGRITIPYQTNYKRSMYYFTAPAGITIVSSDNGRLVVDVPINRYGQRTFTIEVHRTSDDVVIATSVITQYEAALEYFTIEVLEDGVLRYNYYKPIEVNINGGGWFTPTASDHELKAGDVVMIRGENTNKKACIKNITVEGGKFKAYGNPLSLVYGSEGGHFTCEVMSALSGLFAGSTIIEGTIVDAKDLNLDLGLYSYCYSDMFANCPYLTVPPELPQTELAEYCYAGMFDGCTSLESAPVLPATTGLAYWCYYGMFSNCVNLNNIECYATFSGDSAEYCKEWVAHVLTTGGTFTSANNMEGKWAYGDDAIPWAWKDMSLGDTGTTGDYNSQYVTLEILSGGTIEFHAAFNISHETASNSKSTLLYSVNGSDWNNTNSLPWGSSISGYTYSTAITVNQGDIVLLRGYYYSRENAPYTLRGYAPTLYGSTAAFNVYGNAMALLYGDNFRNVSVLNGESRAFAHLFEGTNVVDARNMKIPGGLLAPWAMLDMFDGCQYLTTSPVIPPQEEQSGGTAYVELFCDCYALTDIVCLYSHDVTGDGFQRWTRNVPANGTFTKRSGVSWISGTGGIPEGWTVIESA